MILTLLLLFAQPMLQFPQNDAGTNQFSLPPTAEAVTDDEHKVFRTLNLNFPRPDDPRSVVIDITRGFVEVTGHDRSDVVIEILYPPASTESKVADGLVTQFAPTFELDIDEKTNRITLDTYNNTYVLNLRVKVPKQVDLSLDTYLDGYLHAQGIAGTIHTHSQHCDIHLLDIYGSATAFSYNGNVKVSFLGVAEDAKLDFESYNGSIDVTLPAKTCATAAIAAGRGKFGSMFDLEPVDETSDARIALLSEESKESYQFRAINGGGIPIRIESAKGQISLRKRAGR